MKAYALQDLLSSQSSLLLENSLFSVSNRTNWIFHQTIFWCKSVFNKCVSFSFFFCCCSFKFKTNSVKVSQVQWNRNVGENHEGEKRRVQEFCSAKYLWLCKCNWSCLVSVVWTQNFSTIKANFLRDPKYVTNIGLPET